MYSNNLTLFKTTNVKFSKKVENLTDALRIDQKLFKLPSKKDIFVKPEAVDLSPTELNLFYEHLFSGAFVEAKRLYDEVFLVEGKNIGIPLELEYTYVYLLIKSKFIALLFDNTENRILQVTDFSLGERQIEEFFKEVKTFEQLVLYKSASPNPIIIPSLLKDKITKPVLKVLERSANFNGGGNALTKRYETKQVFSRWLSRMENSNAILAGFLPRYQNSNEAWGDTVRLIEHGSNFTIDEKGEGSLLGKTCRIEKKGSEVEFTTQF